MLTLGKTEWQKSINERTQPVKQPVSNDSPRTKLAKEAKKGKSWKDMTFNEYKQWEAQFSTSKVIK